MSTASKTTTAKPKKSSASKKAPAPVPAESATPAQSATPAPAQLKPQSSYFNLHIDGLGYLSNIREINTATGSFLSCTINALYGSTERPEYTRFDVTVSGQQTSSLIRRCQNAVNEEKKVLIGFKLSNLTADVFTLTKGDHAGESRASLKARLIKISFIKVGQNKVYKAKKPEEPVHKFV
ncbi:STY4534 family ICE replication protein [Edwardsiella ictaluri]|uniref:STY4534 family ICE replication protein n=1 Tax=Edwardsiella ictaluri TaxID=67780 RepID=A0ABY8GKS9_EDWIC|nr:STY4534 family ICE replication protein [Edwardsiella ictaluri]WFN97913.1 STY4534 family ICE replication protein [Edwardsiella ictaluri]